MVIDTKKFQKVAIKYDGHKTKIAKEIGITSQAVGKRIKQNPHIQKAILNVREEALKRALINRTVVYSRLRKGLDSRVVYLKDGIPKQSRIADRHEIREYSKLCLQLFKDLDPDKEQSTQNIATVIFNLLHKSTGSQVIDVV
jgi:predicted transcriptional regulator